METPSIFLHFSLIFLTILSCWCSLQAHGDTTNHDTLLECLSEKFHNQSSIFDSIYTPDNLSYESILDFSIQNSRFTSQSTPRSRVIITPRHESQVPSIILCAKEYDMQIRTRSRGHEFSETPFVILDLIHFDRIEVNLDEKTAWVESGATIGSLYHAIAEASSTLGIFAGIIPAVGMVRVGDYDLGIGIGYGNRTLLRKYGLEANNVLDAIMVDSNGRILDRRSMGEDQFRAVRSGGGASLGVILAWKVRLVDVPEQVTVFTIDRTLEQNATWLIHRWQSIAHTFDRYLFIRIIIVRANLTHNTRNFIIRASFNSIFLGGIERLIPMMRESFPELGLTREDCIEMSWIESMLGI